MSCGTQNYQNINQIKITRMLDALAAKGAIITGDNPWEVDTNNHGVKMTGNWDEEKELLEIEITDKDWYVPCPSVWSVIDDLLNKMEEEKV